MAKIIRFKTPQDNLIETLERILELARNGEIENFILAAKLPNGEVATSWSNADVGTRNELVSHLQLDVVYAVIEANMDQLVEWV
ncbi:MAG: hypothetical protein AB7V16_08795 [Vulcanibacillus sp.]